jgi:plastocyanin
MKLNSLFLTLLFVLAFVHSSLAQAEKSILATRVNGSPAWSAVETKVAPGDVVTWKIQQGKHSLFFENFVEANKFFVVDASSLPIAERAPFPLPAQGTEPKQVATTLLVKVTMKELPTGTTQVTIPFFCGEHPGGMKGKLVLEAPSPAPAGADNKLRK